MSPLLSEIDVLWEEEAAGLYCGFSLERMEMMEVQDKLSWENAGNHRLPSAVRRLP